MIIKQISVFVENKAGRLADITAVLGRAGIDIRFLSIADTSDFGILRMLVNRPEEAVQVLKEAGLTAKITDVIGVRMSDVPGTFAGVAKIMADVNISIDYMYAFISRKTNEAFLIMRIEEIETGMEALKAHGVALLPSEELYDL
ncbi:MAG TPA: ACT domain-containing protein [Firmicutes bacterium]|nr:ACT domain-containing protein [Bacillota bacterium]